MGARFEYRWAVNARCHSGSLLSHGVLPSFVYACVCVCCSVSRSRTVIFSLFFLPILSPLCFQITLLSPTPLPMSVQLQMFGG